ncbi:MAG: cysteine desulfurase [Candidatus Krumholzibacteriota bacterium]|nr:cysteine desulfurase [Candidatus Krumholzibacteriota bacterium]
MPMNEIYMDYNATTPVRDNVLDVFRGALAECYGNASSAHFFGRRAKKVLDEAREVVAAAINARPREIVFTSGGTESDNLALKGVALGTGAGHVITTSIEHPGVLEAGRFLERECFDVTYLPVTADGCVCADDVRDAIRDDTLLVSVMWVNNETGVINPISEIATAACDRGVPFHTDAVQAFARLPIDVSSLPVDFLSISGHKFGAPKGIGVLYVRAKQRLEPVLHGGGQEWNMRSGTQNVPAIAALGEATRQVNAELEAERERVGALRDRLEKGVLESVPDSFVNGFAAPRVANTSNIRFAGADGEALLLALDAEGIAVSSASACAAAHTEPSHVLMAMGLSRRQAEDSMRFSLGHGSTVADVDNFLEVIPGLVARVRSIAAAS